MVAVAGKVCRIRVTAAAATSSTDNAATLSTSGLVLSIDSTDRRHWNRASSTHIQVFEGAVNRTTDIAEINYVLGQVTLDTAHSTASSWTIDTEYLTSSYLGEGRDWSANVDIDILDRTTFSTSTADVQWRSVTPGLSGGSVEINRFWGGTTGPAFFDRLAAGQDTIVELWRDHTSRNKLEGWAFVEGDDFEVPVEELASESVTLRVDGQLYHSTA
jgi:hypothetical protein